MFAWAAVLALMALTFGGIYARFRVRHLDRVRDYRNDFFKAAENLVDAEETPDIVVGLVDWMANRIGNRSTPWFMLRALINGRIRKTYIHPSKTAIELRIALGSLREPLNKQLDKTVTAFTLAVTYNSTLIGWLIRRVALYRLNKPTKRDFDGHDDAEAVVFGLVNPEPSTLKQCA